MKVINELIKEHKSYGSQLAEKAKQIDLEVERKRIDSFTRLSEGSTTGDAELIDGRIGADGIAYSNIGSSIRGQISAIARTNISSNINDNNKATDGFFTTQMVHYKAIANIVIRHTYL